MNLLPSSSDRSAFASVKQQAVILLFLALVAIPVVILCREFLVDRPPENGVKVSLQQDYHGWTNSIRLANAQVEVVVVPAIGRVMQFQFLGEEGPFWENAERFGKAPDPSATEWGNFGGDKTWPSPQSAWSEWTPRAWPPPPAFDSMPVSAVVTNNRVVLESTVDPYFGIQTRREIRLDPLRPRMTIVTTYTKENAGTQTNLLGDSRPVGVWVITQLKDPKAVFIPVPKGSTNTLGYVPQSEALPLDLKLEKGILSLRRDPAASHKIGTESGTLVWIGDKLALRIDSPRLSGVEYPDSGSSAEVYTNPDPLPYVELEMLGPIRPLKVGDTLSQTNVYTLFQHRSGELEAEAQRILEF